MRIPAAIRTALSLLALMAGLASCTGDGSTLDPFGAPLGPPRVMLSPTRVDLSLIEGTGQVVQITISNEGGRPLRVDDVTSPSPFILPAFEGPLEIRSGETASVSTTVSAVSALMSPQSGSIDVASNDPEDPVVSVPVRLIVTAGPRSDIQVSPDSLTVRVAPDGSDVRTLRIRNTGTAELHVTDITGAAFLTPGITTATMAVGDSVDVVITADAAGLAVGNHLGEIVIASDDEDEPQLTIPVLLSVESPFPATLSAIQQNVFSPRCGSVAGCHGGPFPMVGLNLTSADSSYTSMANINSVEVPTLKLVEPGNADDSYLIVKIVPNDPRRQNAVMPATGSALSTDEIEAIRRWINEGAQRN